MIRPPARDQPSPEESARLAAELHAAVAAAQRLAASLVIPSPDHHRSVRVLAEGPTTSISLAEHGQVLVEREVDTPWLIQHLEHHGQSYAVLARLLTER